MHWANFNCVDLCRDAAKHASMMALAAPSVLTTQQNSNKIWFFTHLIVSLASPKILTLEKTQIKFVFLLT